MKPPPFFFLSLLLKQNRAHVLSLVFYADESSFMSLKLSYNFRHFSLYKRCSNTLTLIMVSVKF